MKIHFTKSTGIALIATCLSVPIMATAHVSSDQSHGIKVEKIDSKTGTPKDIHIEKAGDEIKISGKIKRKSHNNMKIRGHADIDLLDDKGQIIEHATSRLSTTSVKASRNRFSNFTASLPMPSAAKFTVRIIHTTSELDHSH